MPIRHYLEEGVVFTPETLSAMGTALEAATEVLGIGDHEKQRQIVAKFLIRLAQQDNSLDATALRDRAVAALGGVTYSAPAGLFKPSNQAQDSNRRRSDSGSAF